MKKATNNNEVDNIPFNKSLSMQDNEKSRNFAIFFTSGASSEAMNASLSGFCNKEEIKMINW